VLPKPLNQLAVADLQALCENRVLEGRFLDFKAGAIGVQDREKREFLADVSAFANASGGDLILGVRTKDGAADEVCGIDLTDPDKEKQRLVSIVRDGLEPRVVGMDIAWLRIEGTRGVMVVRIPRSWSAPHRVTFLRDMNFFIRNPAGRHPMSVDELRFHFLAGQELAERIRAFRDSRVAAIQRQDLPFTLVNGPIVALHVVPLSAVADPMDLRFRYEDPDRMEPLRPGSSNWVHTLEGFATYTMPQPSLSYSLVSRNGSVEGVGPLESGQGANVFSLHAFERLVCNGWTGFLKFAGHRGIQPPFYVFATLIGVSGRKPTDDPVEGGESTVAKKGVVLLPETVVGLETSAARPEQIFRRLFDVAANAFGLSGSPRYRADGTYTG
jgi:Putative DNA-binding domain